MDATDTPQNPTRPTELEPEDIERPASLAPTEHQLEYETPGGRDAAAHDPYAALRLPNYLMYAVGWMISVQHKP